MLQTRTVVEVTAANLGTVATMLTIVKVCFMPLSEILVVKTFLVVLPTTSGETALLF